MSNNCHIETASCLLIAAQLNAACSLYEDAPVFVTSGFVTLTTEEELQEGTDYSLPNAGGSTCGPELRGEDRVKWLNGSGQLCMTDWAFMSAMSGNTIVVDVDGNVVGYDELDLVGSGGVCNPSVSRPRWAVTVIRRAATGDGGCVVDVEESGATPFVATTFPNTTEWKFSKSAFEDARQTWDFTFRSYKSPNPMRGPLNLRPSGVTPQAIPTTAFISNYFVNPSSLPSPSCESIEHPVPTGTADGEEEG